jgi:hypothetical protein
VHLDYTKVSDQTCCQVLGAKGLRAHLHAFARSKYIYSIKRLMKCNGLLLIGTSSASHM